MMIDQNVFEKTYTQSEVVEAAGCSKQAITNYISKNDLCLVSEAPGRGRARTFQVLDVMQVALMTALVELTHDANASSLLCREMLTYADDPYSPGIERMVDSTSEETETVPTATVVHPRTFSDDRHAPLPYQEIDLDNPWFILFEISQTGDVQNASRKKLDDAPISLDPSLGKGYYLNVTRVFMDALTKLEKLNANTH